MPPRQDTNSTEVGSFYTTITRKESELSKDTCSEKDTYEDDDDSSSSSSSYSYGQSREPLTGKASCSLGQGISPTISLPILVFIDMLAVSLVVPLLFQYYKNAGVTSANERELLSSVFSSSQIVGGVVLGAMTDAQILKRKTILFLSFGGSAVAYAMIAFGGFHALIFSRILVGLVKQTMTVTTSILTRCTTEQNRTKYLGRLQSSATASWIVGPSIGAILFRYVDHRAPALLACALFIFNMILAAVLLKEGIENDERPQSSMQNAESDDKLPPKKNHKKKSDFWTNLKACFGSPSLGSIIATTLVFNWVNRATSYSSLGSYYENMYGLEPHHRGYIQSYQQVLGFIIQSSLIQPLLSRMGGEHKAICGAALLTRSCNLFGITAVYLLLPLGPISCHICHYNIDERVLTFTSYKSRTRR